MVRFFCIVKFLIPFITQENSKGNQSIFQLHVLLWGRNCLFSHTKIRIGISAIWKALHEMLKKNIIVKVWYVMSVGNHRLCKCAANESPPYRMPNSLPHVVVHSEEFAANLAYSPSCAPKILRKKKKSLSILKRFSFGLEPKITYLPHGISFKPAWKIHHGNKFNSLSQAVSQSSPRPVKNPSGTRDQNYLKSTENQNRPWV